MCGFERIQNNTVLLNLSPVHLIQVSVSRLKTHQHSCHIIKIHLWGKWSATWINQVSPLLCIIRNIRPTVEIKTPLILFDNIKQCFHNSIMQTKVFFCWLIIILIHLQHSQGILTYDWEVNSDQFFSSLHSPSFHLLLLPAASWHLHPHPEGSKSCDSAPCPPPMCYRDRYWSLFYLRTRAKTWKYSREEGWKSCSIQFSFKHHSTINSKTLNIACLDLWLNIPRCATIVARPGFMRQKLIDVGKRQRNSLTRLVSLLWL